MNKPIVTKLLAGVAIIFGLMTIRSGGTTLFVPEAREASGDVVMFVLWINFIMGFAYVASGVGMFMDKTWAKTLAMVIAGVTLVTYVAFGVNIVLGGIYKIKTVKAMAVRSIVWIIIALQAKVTSKA